MAGLYSEVPTAPMSLAKECHCPFGCHPDDLDDLGYCDHLVGFTSNNQAFESLVLGVGFNGKPNGTWQVRGDLMQPIEKGDKLVNPESYQIIDGIKRLAKRWVSARVYRERGRQETTE